MEIMKLIPAGKDYLWGGTRLKSEYGKKIEINPLAETWECSVHPEGFSKVENGIFKGKALAEVIEEFPQFKGKNNPDGFPVLIKLIDASKDLSVQVHPDDEYALKNENQNGKTEMWYILDAEKDSEIVYGFERKVSIDEAEKAVEDGSFPNLLHREKVKKGDAFFIPSGTVHAVGRGIVLAEIQENSDVTYRIYDYNRTDRNGKKRELHIKKALETMNFEPLKSNSGKREITECFLYSTEILCRCSYFDVRKITVKRSYSFIVRDDSFQVILCIDGNGTVSADSGKYDIKKGDCFFLPASMGDCTLRGSLSILKVQC